MIFKARINDPKESAMMCAIQVPDMTISRRPFNTHNGHCVLDGSGCGKVVLYVISRETKQTPVGGLVSTKNVHDAVCNVGANGLPAEAFKKKLYFYQLSGRGHKIANHGENGHFVWRCPSVQCDANFGILGDEVFQPGDGQVVTLWRGAKVVS